MTNTIQGDMQIIPFRLEAGGANIGDLAKLAKGNMILVNETVELSQFLKPAGSLTPVFGHIVRLLDTERIGFKLRNEIEPMYPTSSGTSRKYFETISLALHYIENLRHLVAAADGVKMNLIVVDTDQTDLMAQLRRLGYAPNDVLKIPRLITIGLIVATDQNRAIGKNNQIPWKHKGDMQDFSSTTSNNVVIMGRKTFESMGSKPLKYRHNIVVSSQLPRQQLNIDKMPDSSFAVVNTLQEAVDVAAMMAGLVYVHTNETVPIVYVIGGQALYEAFLPYATFIRHNVIETKIEGADTFFPEIGMAEWEKEDPHGWPTGDLRPGDLPWRRQYFRRRR